MREPARDPRRPEGPAWGKARRTGLPWLPAALAVASMSGCGDATLASRGRKAKIERDLTNIATVAAEVSRGTGKAPESIEAMIEWGSDASSQPEMGTMCQFVPKDPWGRSYVYAITSDGRPLVACLGSDGQPGGDGDAADTLRIGGG